MTQRTMKITDFASFRYPTNLAMSPDGKFGVFAVVQPSIEGNSYDSNLWLYNDETKAVSKLTSGNKERNFIWIDNETILFTGNREAEYQKKVKNGETWTCFYTMNVTGGEAVFKDAVPHKVGKMQYQNGAIYASVHEAYQKREKDFEVFDEMPFWSNGVGITNKVRDRLYRYDLATGEMKVLSPEYGQVEAFWAENDSVFFTCNVYTQKKMPQNALYEYVEATGEVIEILPQGAFSITYACRRNGRIDFMGSDMKRFGYNENPDLYTIENGEPKMLLHYDFSTRSACSTDMNMAGGTNQATVDDIIYVIGVNGTDVVMTSFDLDGNANIVIGEAGTVNMFDIKNGKIFFIGRRNQTASELYCWENGVETKLTSLNEEIQNEIKISPVEHFVFVHEGVELDGFVIKPVDYDPNKSYPGILTIHGGPKGAYGAHLQHEFQTYASSGYFVFYTNPTGSDGKGNEFADIVAKQGSIDYDQLMFFTDEVLRRYPAMDGNRLAVMGISYGGFMSNWIIGHTDRFKAAVPQCSIANWVSKTNTTDIGYSFNTTQLGGDVWHNHDKMWELSPMKYADQIKTPALIIHADEDYRTWLTEGVQMFSALQYHGVPSKLLIIHGEHHGVSNSGKPNKRIRRLEEIHAWLDQYVKQA